MPRLAKTIKATRFKGVNNVDNAEDLGLNTLQEAVNLDLTDKGQLKKRAGATLAYPGRASSLFFAGGALFYVLNGRLIRNHAVDLGPVPDTIYPVELQNKVYFTSISRSGIIDGDEVKPWQPTEQNRLRIDGWEDENGVSFDLIDYNPTFYQDGPTGHLITRLAGRIYIAQGSALLFCDPMAPALWSGAGFNFGDRITALMPLKDGMWVCANGLYWLSGNDPTMMKLDLIEECRGIEGTAVRIPGNRFPIDQAPAGDVWLLTTTNGVLAMKTNGFVANVTEDVYEMPYREIGSAGFLEIGGVNRYVTQTKAPSNTDRAVGRDSITVRIIRNAQASK